MSYYTTNKYLEFNRASDEAKNGLQRTPVRFIKLSQT